MEQRSGERRKVNQAVGAERRGRVADRRRCPQCGSAVRSHTEERPGGSELTRYCTKCSWKERTRQVDEDRLKALAGFELTVHGVGRKAVLELEPDFLRVSGIRPGDTLELKPLYAPGKGKDVPLHWVLKRLE
jgi:hypothetical protein